MNACERFAVQGAELSALIRGPSGAPVLLLVQAGPGFPMIHEAAALEARLALEAQYRVVYWDQRGTGLSARAASGPLSLELLSADVAGMVAALCDRLQVDALDVLGFSLGGSLALTAAASGAPIRRVVAVGPDIDLSAGDHAAWQFARDEAMRRGHRRALRELEYIGRPPHNTSEQFMTRVKWVTNFGGVATGHSFASIFSSTLWRLFASPHYSLSQVVETLRAMQRSQSQILPQLNAYTLCVASLPVPVSVIQGRLDAVAPAHIAHDFMDRLVAPRGKQLLWLDDCAHMPHFEAPERFRELLAEALD